MVNDITLNENKYYLSDYYTVYKGDCMWDCHNKALDDKKKTLCQFLKAVKDAEYYVRHLLAERCRCAIDISIRDSGEGR